ncbi:hypothetical protein GGS24DRAFT_438603 [Hypoxylon argillaceum]|nr:hypothetical protein GGS24DRAFT_438603 [Hypoxylon argillaceum]KAI1154920.1 hypothetical protein F4825DRAFT_409594 [Nemania diffusa]
MVFFFFGLVCTAWELGYITGNCMRSLINSWYHRRSRPMPPHHNSMSDRSLSELVCTGCPHAVLVSRANRPSRDIYNYLESIT